MAIVPRLTGIREKPQLNDDKKMIPIVRFGLAIMSSVFWSKRIRDDLARAMVMSAITRCCGCRVGNLDILVVDMPPGTATRN